MNRLGECSLGRAAFRDLGDVEDGRGCCEPSPPTSGVGKLFRLANIASEWYGEYLDWLALLSFCVLPLEGVDCETTIDGCA